MRRAAVVASVYVAAAILLTWPLAAAIGTKLGALEGPGDPYLNLWTLGWGMQSWWHDPLGTLAGRAFDAPIFYPSPLTLTYSDHQLLQSLIAAPLYAATNQLTLTYNVVLLGSIAASGLAMHLLARSVTGSTAAAFFAGLAWACWPYRTRAPVAPATAGALLPAAGIVGADPRGGRTPLAGRGMARRVRGPSGNRLGVLRRDDRAGAAGGGPGARMGNRAVARAPLLVARGGGGPAGGGDGPAGGGALPPIAGGAKGSAETSTRRQITRQPGRVTRRCRRTTPLYGRSGVLAPRPPAPGERDRQHVEHQMFPGVVLARVCPVGAVARLAFGSTSAGGDRRRAGRGRVVAVPRARRSVRDVSLRCHARIRVRGHPGACPLRRRGDARTHAAWGGRRDARARSHLRRAP